MPMLDNFQLIKAEIMLHDEENRLSAAVRARAISIFFFFNFFSLPSLSMHTRNLGQTVTVFSVHCFFFSSKAHGRENDDCSDYIITTGYVSLMPLSRSFTHICFRAQFTINVCSFAVYKADIGRNELKTKKEM